MRSSFRGTLIQVRREAWELQAELDNERIELLMD